MLNSIFLKILFIVKLVLSDIVKKKMCVVSLVIWVEGKDLFLFLLLFRFVSELQTAFECHFVTSAQ